MEALDIPKCCRQPTSRSRKDSEFEVSGGKDESSSSPINKLEGGTEEHVSRYSEVQPDASLFPSCDSWKRPEEGSVLNSNQLPVSEVQPVHTDDSPDSCKNRTAVPNLNNHVTTHSSEVPLPSTPDNSRPLATGNADVRFPPGFIVWAKTVDHEWWPAEVVDKTVDGECVGSQHAGHVPVKLIGNDCQAWFDPVNLSQFNHWYEERSKNPSKEFQDALKQALRKHLHTRPPVLPGTGQLKSSTRQIVLALDAWNSPSSSRTKYDSINEGTGRSRTKDDPINKWKARSRTEDDSIDEGRAKRKRKQKLHFDASELKVEEKPIRKLRRLKIMRSLGLIAPVGSPFTLSHGKSAC